MNADLSPTPGQTVGPFFGYALPSPGGADLVPPGTPGAVELTGLVRAGDGVPVPDALIEIWQAASDGSVPRAAGSLRRVGHTFTGFGRAATDSAGRYRFTTVRPGPTSPGCCPFIAVTVLARGLLNRLFTRAYVPTDGARSDALLERLDPQRRACLIVTDTGTTLNFDIHLQGTDETVFLRFPQHRP